MCWALLIVIITVVTFQGTAAVRRPYVAAAYEHARFGSLNDPPQLVIATNLEKYIKAAEIAKSKDVDIIVYPETGLYFPGDRAQLKNYLEEIPDPKKARVNPCEDIEQYHKRPIILTLSCMAKNNSIVVVANTGDIQNCSGEADCPEDGSFHYNTNVVFDRDGTLLLKYYKEHLFYELGIDLPKQQQDPTFETDFGTFATFICFDVEFERMSQVAKWPQVDGIMFSYMWFDSSPQYVSNIVWQGWGIGNKMTIVASNVQIPGYGTVGSGIFHNKYGTLGYTYSPDGISKLVIANVPVDENDNSCLELKKSIVIAFNSTNTWNFEETGDTVPEICSRSLLNNTDKLMEEFRCSDEDTSNYTLVKLTSPSGYEQVCSNGMCCSVSYSMNDMKENFYLGVFNGTLNFGHRYPLCEESCFLARCDSHGDQPCSIFPRRTDTVFHHVTLTANFSTEYVYPSVVSSKVRLVPLSKWNYSKAQTHDSFESTIHFHSQEGIKLLNAGYKARCYQRDPPYVR